MRPSVRANWYVLTGRPCSGISTTLEALRGEGFKVVPEAARLIIDEKLAAGMTVEEVRQSEQAFQQEIVERKIAVETRLEKNQLYIFDRGLPDSVAYHEMAALNPDEVLRLCDRNLYAKIFFMEPLPYVPDYARTENDAALAWLERKLRRVYLDLGYTVVSVPAGPVAQRLDLIRSHIRPRDP